MSKKRAAIEEQKPTTDPEFWNSLPQKEEDYDQHLPPQLAPLPEVVERRTSRQWPCATYFSDAAILGKIYLT